MSNISEAIKISMDKFKVYETAPYLPLSVTGSPTGSYGSYGSYANGLKNVYNLKFKDRETNSVTKSSGILGNNFPSYTGYGP